MRGLIVTLVGVGFLMGLEGSLFAATEADDFARVHAERKVSALNTKSGFQIYECVNQAWVSHGAEATLVDESGRVQGRHLFVSNPENSKQPAPAWELEDGSSIIGQKKESRANPKGVDLLVLTVKTNNGKGALAKVTDVERTDIRGGQAPKAACASSAGPLRIPYEARYVFYSSTL